MGSSFMFLVHLHLSSTEKSDKRGWHWNKNFRNSAPSAVPEFEVRLKARSRRFRPASLSEHLMAFAIAFLSTQNTSLSSLRNKRLFRSDMPTYLQRVIRDNPASFNSNVEPHVQRRPRVCDLCSRVRPGVLNTHRVDRVASIVPRLLFSFLYEAFRMLQGVEKLVYVTNSSTLWQYHKTESRRFNRHWLPCRFGRSVLVGSQAPFYQL
jgi:hypothetical protein